LKDADLDPAEGALSEDVGRGAEDGLSPSLLGEDGGFVSYEVKFLVEDGLAREIAAWARGVLDPDRHGEAALAGAYRIHTLYLDTPGLDSYLGVPSYKKRRLRVRRYGTSDLLYLEQKTKTGERVSKRRVPVRDGGLDRLGGPAPLEEAPAAWFHRRVARRGLVPTARLSYLRTAFVGRDPREPSRLTLDDAVVTDAEGAWRVTPSSNGVELLAGQQVLELKYRHAMPATFKDLVARHALVPRVISKYRFAVAALGLQPGSRDHA
jgi:hypothetical protein